MSVVRFGSLSVSTAEWLSKHPNMNRDFPDLVYLLSWRNFLDGVTLPQLLDSKTFELEGSVTCVCGKVSPCILRFPNLLSYDPVDFCKQYEKASHSCFCSYSASLSYMDDCVNPYLLPTISYVIEKWLDEGNSFEVIDVGVSQANHDAARCPIRLSRRTMQMVNDYSCFELDDVLNEALGILFGADTVKPDLDKMMLSHVDSHVVGVAPERALFEAGATYVKDPYFFDSRLMQERAGFPVAKSRYRTLEQIAIGFCCAAENKQLDYMLKVFGSVTDNDRRDLQLVMERFVVDHLTNFPNEPLTKYAKSKVFFPQLRFLVGQIESKLLNSIPFEAGYDPNDDKSKEKGVAFSHGVYGNVFRDSEINEAKDWYARASGIFKSAYESLNKCRVARRASVVLDTIFKPCSSIETWTYGNKYSTVVKWKTALKDPVFTTGGTVLAAGCGKKNWWQASFKKLQHKFHVDVDYVDVNTFGRAEVRLMDVNEVKPDSYDHIISDVQVALDWHAIFQGARKSVTLKLIPAMHKTFPALSDAMIAHGFELVTLYACGRLHNGEEIAVFKKKKPLTDGQLRKVNKGKRRKDKVTSEEYFKIEAKKLIVENLHRDIRAIMGIMAGHMVHGESVRQKHLRLLLLGIETVSEPDPEFMECKTDYKVVSILKPIHRSKGGVARWVLEQSTPYPQFETEGVSRVAVHSATRANKLVTFSSSVGARTDKVVTMTVDTLGKHGKNRPPVCLQMPAKQARKEEELAKARGDTVIPKPYYARTKVH